MLTSVDLETYSIVGPETGAIGPDCRVPGQQVRKRDSVLTLEPQARVSVLNDVIANAVGSDPGLG